MIGPANNLGFVEQVDLPPRQAEEREVLFRIADELEALADETDAAGRGEGPGLRSDARVLRRVAQDLGNLLTIGTIGIRTT